MQRESYKHYLLLFFYLFFYVNLGESKNVSSIMFLTFSLCILFLQAYNYIHIVSAYAKLLYMQLLMHICVKNIKYKII